MPYKEDFDALLRRETEIEEQKVFVFRNKNNCEMKLIPDVGSYLLGEYFGYLKESTKDKRIIDFVDNEIREDVLQVIDTKYLGIWKRIAKARQKIKVDNQQEVRVESYINQCNVVMMEVEFKTDDKDKRDMLYLLSVYRNVAEWYRNSIRFADWLNFPDLTKKQVKRSGELVRIEGDILAFMRNVDAVIYGDRCYIIDETNFNKIFKYDQVAAKIVQENKTQLKNLGFIYNWKELLGGIEKSTRLKKEMAKAILSGRIAQIRDCDASQIRDRIQKRKELEDLKKEIKFEGDRIIVNEKNCKTVVGILTGRINLDVITNRVNGLE